MSCRSPSREVPDRQRAVAARRRRLAPRRTRCGACARLRHARCARSGGLRARGRRGPRARLRRTPTSRRSWRSGLSANRRSCRSDEERIATRSSDCAAPRQSAEHRKCPERRGRGRDRRSPHPRSACCRSAARHSGAQLPLKRSPPRQRGWRAASGAQVPSLTPAAGAGAHGVRRPVGDGVAELEAVLVGAAEVDAGPQPRAGDVLLGVRDAGPAPDQLPGREPERRAERHRVEPGRLADRAAPPASSRPFPQPGPSPQSPS